MMNVTAIVSLLHEPTPAGCTRRLLRGEPVLSWTLRRIRRGREIGQIAIVCWEDQLEAVKPIAAAEGAYVLSKRPRVRLPKVDAIAAGQRWSDGWRGGLLASTHFDLGFYGPWVVEIARQLESEAVLLVSADAALVDPALLDGLVAHARSRPGVEYCFSPAAPGLCGALVRTGLLEKLAEAGGHLGQLLNYHPDLPGRDPIGKDECAPTPTTVARTMHRFVLDSDRQLRRIERAVEALNGSLIATEAEGIVARVAQSGGIDALPRDVVLELTTNRETSPVYWPGRHVPIGRPMMSIDRVRRLLAELGEADDVRLTLGGVGDPLLSPDAFEVMSCAVAAGIDAIHVETDLVGLTPKAVEDLSESPADVVSVFIPATSPQTYAAIMGRDRLDEVLKNMQLLVQHRREREPGTPIVVPTFVKCRANLHEMEAWYDHWLRLLGCAAIVGPSDYGGTIPDVSAADMTPPKRVACRRLASRMTILCDGRMVSCEQDAAGLQVLGRMGEDRVEEAWKRVGEMRGNWERHVVCGRCREWHR